MPANVSHSDPDVNTRGQFDSRVEMEENGWPLIVDHNPKVTLVLSSTEDL